MAKHIIAKHPPLVTGPWTLADLQSGKLGYPKNGLKVFSCFHCGGGSTMGYKLAGFDVIGGIEIDSDMIKLYRKNHQPKERLSFNMPIQDFQEMDTAILRRDCPELFDLDVLDGSPPCSSFSMSGLRENGWNKKKMFREGQTKQVLDDLFFYFINVAKMLKPKMVVAENVKGLIIKNARGYVKQIFKAFDDAGYDTQLFLLNASTMGVPQARERVFFIARRKDLVCKQINMSFNEPIISVSMAISGAGGERKQISSAFAYWWKRTPPGKPFSYAHPNKSFFNSFKLHPGKPANTVTSTNASIQSLWDKPETLSSKELLRIQSFPDDYDFLDQKTKYVCGMSVPPLMMQRVATEVAKALQLRG